jgi:hypothetical protein
MVPVVPAQNRLVIKFKSTVHWNFPVEITRNTAPTADNFEQDCFD